MKHNNNSILMSILLALLLLACNQQPQAVKTNLISDSGAKQSNPNFTDGFTSPGRLFPDKLRGLANEIIALHSPNPCFADYEDSMYIWKHNTTIQANEDLQLVEYGSFVYTKNGWYQRVTMGPAEFAAYYHCPSGLLKKGVVYTDKESWRRDKKLTAGDAMWYFIATDKNGRRVKGTAPIETEGQLLNAALQEATVKTAAINWTGYGELGGYSLTGTVALQKATIMMDSNRISKASIVMDAASIAHKDGQLQEHLRGKDFFDVIAYPTASFESESINYTSAGTAQVKGIMNIKGIKKQLQFPLTIKEDNNGTLLQGKIQIDRTEFGIKYNSKSFFGDLGDQAIKNRFDLLFELVIK